MSETPPNQPQPQQPPQGPGPAQGGAPGSGAGGRPGYAPPPGAPYGAPPPGAPVPPPGAAPSPGGPAPSAEDPVWAMVAHLSGAIVACLGWVPPLIVFSSRKERSPFTRQHAAEALNFQLTLLIPYAISWIVYIVLALVAPQVAWIGSVLIALVWVLSIVFGVLAAVRANKGGWYRYPVSLRLVK